jgi:hypothetical protein
MGWMRELWAGLYDIYKKNNASQAQKKARKEAEQEVYSKLLSQGVLTDLVSQLADFEIMYLDHLKKYHGAGLKKVIADDEPFLDEDSPAPPPPPYLTSMPQQQPQEEQRALTTQEKMLLINQRYREG